MRPAPSGTARIGAVAWEGDPGSPGTRLALDGAGADAGGGFQDAGNFADSSAAGAVGPPNTFGTDVDSFHATSPTRVPRGHRDHDGDTYFLGVLTVTSG